MAIALNSLPAKCLLLIFQKMNPNALVNLRKASREIDNFSEDNRFSIGKFFEKEFALWLYIWKDRFHFQCGSTIITDLFKQLSCIKLRQFGIILEENENSVDSQVVEEIFKTLEKLKFSPHLFVLKEEYMTQFADLLPIIFADNVLFEGHGEISFTELFSHICFKRAKYICIPYFSVPTWTDFPEHNFFDWMKGHEEIMLHFVEEQSTMAQNAMKKFISDIQRFEVDNMNVQFTWYGEIDPMSFDEKFRLIWSHVSPYKTYNEEDELEVNKPDEVFLLPLGKKIVIMSNCAFEYNLGVTIQIITLSIIDNEKKAAKNALLDTTFQELPSVQIVDNIFKFAL